MSDIQAQMEAFMQGSCFDDARLRAKMEQELSAKLSANRPLVVKLGIDPTTPELHLGHVVPLRKLKQLQDWGHQTTWVVGDFTARVGDPEGRSPRKPIPKETARAYARTYCEQAANLLRLTRTEMRHNSEWLRGMPFEDVIQLTSSMTLGRLLDMKFFSGRVQEHLPIHIHELLYSAMQAYDSVYLGADVEIGGVDQLPNMLVSRDLQRTYGQEPQVVLPLPLLRGLDGKQKMADSNANTINLSDPAHTMYGKVMSIPDTLMPDYFALVLGWLPAQIEDLQSKMKNGELHPRDAKMRLAREITALFWGNEAAEKAQDEFISQFRDKQMPRELPQAAVPAWVFSKPMRVVKMLFLAGLVKSKSEGRRLVLQGGVKVDGVAITNVEDDISFKEGNILQIGKRNFVALKKA